MNVLSLLIPSRDERHYLGGFYKANFVAELLNIVQPFQFVFLLLVVPEPSWALIPLLVEHIVVFCLEIPTGMVADRWGRKVSVVLGEAISSVGWFLVPLALLLEGFPQLLLLCGAFAIEGLGQTLVSGAEEAWVVDNLIALKRRDLTSAYFARGRSLSSSGGVISGLATWALLSWVVVDLSWIAALWILAALGQLLSALLLLNIPEHKISARRRAEDEKTMKWWQRETLQAALGAFRRSSSLTAFAAITLLISFVTAITGDAFELSLLTKGLNPKDLAPFAVANDLLGFVTPPLTLVLARHFQLPTILTLLVVIIAAASLVFFTGPSLGVVLCLFLFFNGIDDLWDPLADSMLHAYLPSSQRATLGSIINQGAELMGLASLGVFTLMLGGHGEELRDAIPSLVEAFQGEELELGAVPLSIFNLPASDAALVLMALLGLVAGVILWFFPWDKSRLHRALEELLEVEQGSASSPLSLPSLSLSPLDEQRRKRLIQVKDDLDRRLDHYNPGEQLSWWVAADAFSLPTSTIQQLKEIGPALSDFFAAASRIMHEETWVLQQLEKKFSPSYALLNRHPLQGLPRLIRPDVVCDEQWNVKLVELEITVGARADTAIMGLQYGLSREKSLVRVYAPLVRELQQREQTLALVTAPHEYFEDLPDDARSFAQLLREHEGLDNIVVLSEDNLGSLRFDGRTLWLNERFREPRPIHAVDRFVDIYEIAESHHLGISAILEALLAGAIFDINTCCQGLDEKQWLGLFWHPALAERWRSLLHPEHLSILSRHLPRTWIVARDAQIKTLTGAQLRVEELADLNPDERRFVLKESGTSTTASGAQAFYVLSEMSGEEVDELLSTVLLSGVEHVLQELVESPKINFYALDPENDALKAQERARFKLSPFYVDGKLSDIRFVASNRQYAVNDGNCVVGVVRY